MATNTVTKNKTASAEERKTALVSVLVLLGVFWAVELIDVLIADGALDQYGIVPRTGRGLIGILTAPFLHGDWNHLIANSVPFLLLGGILALRGVRLFVGATLVIILVAGVGTWLVGRGPAAHIGASGVVFGYFGFHLAAGWFERSFKAILVAVGVTIIYGGLIWGVLPSDTRISWEGHLFGFIGGGLAAKLLTGRAS